ncbi:DNA alkylation repair protein [Holospora undulata]|uniref:DNA alkylation repair enzyme n=1 Tax=Holospora undulata HU1 TaxID=1321371 RepID=A0A061JGY9_9PROT|nr:DNA alkylation repair protein [Holospora undulata]ETZ05426.1 DNA alkylation repair enzyme [Holospora undulata HU1]
MKDAMSSTIQSLRKILQDSIDSSPEKASIFFKTGPGDYAQTDKFMGITVPTLRKIAKDFLFLSLEDLGILIQSAINEERLLALIILVQKYKKSKEEQREEIYEFYRTNIRYVNNWNLVDSSAHLIIGAHLFKKDHYFLEKLSESKNIWERRISIVATLYFIRKSELDCTFRIAELLKDDPHDLIHKAVGWMLREAGKKEEKRLILFLYDHAHTLPKTMLRYAMEKLNNEQKAVIIKFKNSKSC